VLGFVGCAQLLALVPMPPDHVDAGTHPLEVDPGSHLRGRKLRAVVRPPGVCVSRPRLPGVLKFVGQAVPS
jgi:hypothetical protein